MKKLGRASHCNADHVLGIASTARGASLAYIGRSGSVRASVLDRWAAAEPVLLFARDEAREIQWRESDLGSYIHDVLVRDFGSFPKVRIFENTIHPWTDWLLRDLGVRAHDIDLIVTSDDHFATCENRLGTWLGHWFPRARIARGIRHHAMHERQAFWSSGWAEAAVLVLDERGGTLSRFTRTGGSRLLGGVANDESNPGSVLEALRSQLGLRPNAHEQLIRMALEADGDVPNELAAGWKASGQGFRRFSEEPRLAATLAAYLAEGEARGDLETRRRNAARAVLDLLAVMLEPLFRRALDLAGCPNLCFGGNLAEYSAAAEAALARVEPCFLHLPPHAGDPGQALGCALYGAYELAGWQPPGQALPADLGPSYSMQELSEAARESGVHVFEPEQPDQMVADLVAEGNVVARFAGRAPLHPEGQAARGVLIDPRRRDAARGFPESLVLAVLEESAPEWFEKGPPGGPKTRIATPTERAKGLFAAIAGPAARIRTVRAGDEPRYHRLLVALRRKTDLPCVFEAPLRLATGSLAETPRDAVECFLNSSDTDCLALESLVLSRQPVGTC